MYYNTETFAYPVSFEQLAAAHPNSSFPPGDFVPPDPYVIVATSAKPAYDPVTQQVIENTPTLVNGVWTQAWQVIEIFSTPEEKAAAQAAQAAAEAANVRAEAKRLRATAVEAITVTTAAGNTFDGDEISQGRMSRAIIGLSTGLVPTVTWVLHNNTTIEATSVELTEALVLAGQAQSAIWVIT